MNHWGCLVSRLEVAYAVNAVWKKGARKKLKLHTYRRYRVWPKLTSYHWPISIDWAMKYGTLGATTLHNFYIFWNYFVSVCTEYIGALCSMRVDSFNFVPRPMLGGHIVNPVSIINQFCWYRQARGAAPPWGVTFTNIYTRSSRAFVLSGRLFDYLLTQLNTQDYEWMGGLDSNTTPTAYNAIYRSILMLAEATGSVPAIQLRGHKSRSCIPNCG